MSEPETVVSYSGLNIPGQPVEDCLSGVEEIAKYLGWTVRKVRYARETGALPIRVKGGIGLYAFRSEILAALKAPDTLAPRPHKKA